MSFTLRAILKFKDESKRERESASEGFGKLGDAAKAAAIGIGGIVAADKIVGIAKLGAQAERVEQRFTAFAGGTEQATEMLEAFQRGAGGAASKMAAMESASKLMQMGLVGNAAEMENVVEMATRMGDQTQAVGDRVADFAALLANQSIPRLDNFGISSGNVRTRIKELQEAMPGLSRETAFMTAVMEEGGDALEKLGPRTEDNLMAFEKMEAQMEDLKVILGQAIVPLISHLAGAFTDALTALTPWVEKLDAAIDAIDRASAESDTFEESLTQIAAKGDNASDIAIKYADAMQTIDEKTRGVNRVVLELGSAFLGTADNSELLHDTLDGLHEQAIDLTNTYEDYTAIIEQYNSLSGERGVIATQAMTREMYQQAKGMTLATNALAANTTMMQHAEMARTDLTRVEKSATEQIGERAAGYALERQALDERTAALRAGAVAWGVNAEQMQALKAAEEERAASMAATNESARQSIEASNQALLARKEAAEEAARGEAALITAMQGATEEMFNQKIMAAIDPAEVGVDTWAELGKEMGLMTQEQVNLAEAAQLAIDLFREGKVDVSDMAEFTGDLYTEASQLHPEFGKIADQYLNTKGKADQLKQRQDALNRKLKLMGEDIGPRATSAMYDFEGETQRTIQPVSELTDSTSDLLSNFEKLSSQTWQVKFVTTYESIGHPVGPPPSQEEEDENDIKMQHGGRGVIRGPATFRVEPGVTEAFWFSGSLNRPSTTTNNSFSYTNNFNNQLVAAIELNRQRMERSKRLNRVMR